MKKIEIDFDRACGVILPTYIAWHEYFTFSEGLFFARLLVAFMEAVKESEGKLSPDKMKEIFSRELEFANQ